MEKNNVQQTHPDFYKEIVELLQGDNRSTPNVADKKTLPLSINVGNSITSKVKALDRGSSRSKSPVLTSSNLDKDKEDTSSTKSLKKSQAGQQSTDSNSANTTKSKPLFRLPPDSLTPPSITAVGTPSLPDPSKSPSLPPKPSDIGQQPSPSYSSFLKKISSIKASENLLQDKVPDGGKISADRPDKIKVGSSAMDGSNKENEPKLANGVGQSENSGSLASLRITKRSPEQNKREGSASLVGASSKSLLSKKSSLSRDPLPPASPLIDKSSPKSTPTPPVQTAPDKIQDEPLSSANIFAGIPFIETKDSTAYKIEALKFYLEKKMGLMTLLSVYQALVANSDSDQTLHELPIMTPEQEKFVPFVHHLVFCELNYFGTN